jgi:hypothetical protein
MNYFFHKLRYTLPNRLLCFFLTVWFFVVISGIPIPVLQQTIQNSELSLAKKKAGPEKDRSQPFPCMFSSCGCNNAEQCWRKCCCHDLKSKLAWAKNNNVTPPDYVISEARENGLLKTWQSFVQGGNERLELPVVVSKNSCSSKAGCPHCAAKKSTAKKLVAVTTKHVNSCCKEKSSHNSTASTKSTCCESNSKKANDKEPALTENSSSQPEGIVILEAMRCRGEVFNLLGFAPMLPVELTVSPVIEVLLIERLTVRSDQVSELILDITTPPPRCAALLA